MGRHCDKPIDLSVVFVFAWTGWEALVRRIAELVVDDVPLPAFNPREKLDAVNIEDRARRFVHEHTQSGRYSLASSGGRRRETRYFGPNVSPEG